MTTKQILIVGGVGLAVYLLASGFFSRRAVAKNLGISPNGQQANMLLEQCDGWDDCLKGLADL